MVPVSQSLTFLKTRGRNKISAYVLLFRRFVCKSVAALEQNAHAFGVSVREATASKSKVLIRLSRDGLAGRSAEGGIDWARLEDGEIVDMLRTPRCLEGGRDVLIRDAAWTLE